MEATTVEIQNVHAKAIKVIDSCVTIEQLGVATAYIAAFSKLYIDQIYTMSWSGGLTDNEKKHRLACLNDLRSCYKSRRKFLKK
jgi:hypothetical protein